MRYAVLLGALILGACEAPDPPATQETSEVEIAVLDAPTNQDVMQMWSRSCALCHVTGNAGAPRVGNADEWQPRLAQGEETLLMHTVEGFNDMPPLGYCMACERDDFVAMIQFMTTGRQP